MARTIRCLVAALALILLPTGAQAGDFFTGFLIDDEAQYFTYLGVRTPLNFLKQDGFNPFVQLFAAGFGYDFKSNGQLLNANSQFVVPSIGVKTDLGSWNIAGLVGPQLRRKEEENLLTGASDTTEEVGVFVQGEGFHWREEGNLHAIFSYGDLDEFFWGRLRGKLRVYKPEKGCCVTFLGWDVEGMGNDDFQAARTGPVVEVPIGPVFGLVRGGYQYSSTFRSGAYTGLEVYFAF